MLPPKSVVFAYGAAPSEIDVQPGLDNITTPFLENYQGNRLRDALKLAVRGDFCVGYSAFAAGGLLTT
jgi:hypothetical protein